ncbi:MAG: hypothetical protein R2749_19505 [Acidimicrobiales bacterium]
MEAVYEACKIDPWFPDQILQICEHRAVLAGMVGLGDAALTLRVWKKAKQAGFPRRPACLPVVDRRGGGAAACTLLACCPPTRR